MGADMTVLGSRTGMGTGTTRDPMGLSDLEVVEVDMDVGGRSVAVVSCPDNDMVVSLFLGRRR